MPDDETAGAALVAPHNEYHQSLLEVWHTGDVGFFPHRYRHCPQSGAGNCCCGRDDRSPLHKQAEARTPDQNAPSKTGPAPE